jgi:hypothetical protein
MRPALALALTAGLVLATATGQEPVQLKWSLKEGETFYAKALTDMDMGMSILGQNIDFTMKTKAVQRFKVLKSSAAGSTIEMTILEMSMEAEGLPGGAGLPGLGGLNEKVKGAKLTAELDADFQVKKLVGYEKFLDKIAGDDDTARAMMGAQLSEGAVGQMVSQVFTSVPKGGAKVGESWTRTTKVPTGGFGDAAVKEKYTLESASDGVAKIAVKGDMTFKLGDKGGFPGLPPGVKISRFDMKADRYTGTQLFDLKTGRLREGTQDMAMKGTMAMSANGMDIELSMKIKAKTTTTISEKNPIVD